MKTEPTLTVDGSLVTQTFFNDTYKLKPRTRWATAWYRIVGFPKARVDRVGTVEVKNGDVIIKGWHMDSEGRAVSFLEHCENRELMFCGYTVGELREIEGRHQHSKT